MGFCPICQSSSNINPVLRRQPIPIYTNACDKDKKNNHLYDCNLNQCSNCGHIYQPISSELRGALETIYLSNQAQITSPLDANYWDKSRAFYLYEKLFRIEKYKNKSILEIGSGNGFILKTLQRKGFKNLVGIEPSINKTKQDNGILFLKEFANKDLFLDREFDFIFSFGVYEHIENPNNITSFVNSHLKEGGELFIYVPNCIQQLNSGYTGMFTHEHINYFIKDSMHNHLSMNGLEIIDDKSDDHCLAIYAKKTTKYSKNDSGLSLYNEYQIKLDRILDKVEKLLNNRNIIIHGACNALNNITGWIGKDFDYTLVDNDDKKQGKIFFGKRVQSTVSIDLNNYDTVLILSSHTFINTIKTSYRKRGFVGHFESV